MATTPKQMAAKAETAPKPAAEADPPAEGQAPEQSTPPAEAPKADEAAKDTPAAASEPAADAKAADPADVADYCAKNGAPQLAASLIREKATMDQVKTRVGAGTEIRKMVAAARATGCAIDSKFEDTAIEKGMSAEEVRSALFDKLTAQQSPEIRSQLSAGGMTKAAESADSGWGKAVDRINARKK